MASRVIAQNLEVREQIGNLKVPHGMVGTDRVRQYQDRTSRVSLQPIEEARIVNRCKRQTIAPCRYRYRFPNRLPNRTRRSELSEKLQPIQDIAREFPTD